MNMIINRNFLCILNCIYFSSYPQVIEMTWRAAEHRAQSLQRELEEELAELKTRSTAMSQLALSEDYIHFLKVWMGK